ARTGAAIALTMLYGGDLFEALDCSDSTRDTYRIALQQLASPIIDRDTLRQAGAQRPRGSKTPLLDKWLDEQDLSIPNKALFWQVLPTDNFEGAYRDGNKVCESN